MDTVRSESKKIISVVNSVQIQRKSTQHAALERYQYAIGNTSD